MTISGNIVPAWWTPGKGPAIVVTRDDLGVMIIDQYGFANRGSEYAVRYAQNEKETRGRSGWRRLSDGTYRTVRALSEDDGLSIHTVVQLEELAASRGKTVRVAGVGAKPGEAGKSTTCSEWIIYWTTLQKQGGEAYADAAWANRWLDVAGSGMTCDVAEADFRKFVQGRPVIDAAVWKKVRPARVAPQPQPGAPPPTTPATATPPTPPPSAKTPPKTGDGADSGIDPKTGLPWGKRVWQTYPRVVGFILTTPMDLPDKQEQLAKKLKENGWIVFFESVGGEFDQFIPRPGFQTVVARIGKKDSVPSTAAAEAAMIAASVSLRLSYNPYKVWAGEVYREVVKPTLDQVKKGTMDLIPFVVMGAGAALAVMLLK